MKAFLIDPADQAVKLIEINSLAEIVALIGFDTVIADDLGNEADKLYFDEECFLRGTEGRFQIDTLIPVSGNGVIIGTNEDGTFKDVKFDIEDLESRIKFL